MFVRPGIPEFMRDRAVPAADIITPNQFELDWLAGAETRTLADVKAAVASVHALGPGVVLVTSVLTEETPGDAIDLMAAEGGRFWRVRTPKLSLSVNGAGDAVAALFFARYLEEGSVPGALAHAAAAVFGLLTVTLETATPEAGPRELALVRAQDEFVRPSRAFAPEPI